MAVEPLDMRSGTEAALARVCVCSAPPTRITRTCLHRRANRMKVLVHDGIGVWLAARRLNAGRFVWAREASVNISLTRAQFDALVFGLPWQMIGEAGIIKVL